MKETIKNFNLCFHGSRSLKDERVKIIILEMIEKYKPTTILTSAEPGGVCEIARQVAKEQAIPLKVYFLNFKYLKGAFEHRSKDTLLDTDYVVFIHDGESKGTMNELKLAKKLNIPYLYYKLDKAEYEYSIGFDIAKDWDIDLDIVDINI